MAIPSSTDDTPLSRLRHGAALLRSLIARRPRLFTVSVSGAALFALCTVASSWGLQWVIDHVITPRFDEGRVATGTLLSGLALIVGIGALRALAVVVRRTFAGRTQWGVADSISRQVIDRIAAQPIPWLRAQSTGDLIARVGVDVDATIAVLAPLPFATSVIVLIAMSSVWLVATDVVIGVAAVSVFPVLAALNILYERTSDRHFRASQENLGALSSAVHESFEGVSVVKAFGAEQRETDRLAEIAARLRESRIGVVRVRSMFEALLDAVPNMVNIGLLVGGAYRVRSGDLTVGQLTSIVFLFTLLVFPLRIISYALAELPRSQAGWDRVRSLLDTPLQRDPADTITRGGRGTGLELRGVSVGHEPGRDVLSLVTATVPAGRTVALVGATGAGKTTLLHAIAGLIERREGDIVVPSGEVTIVFQEPFLLAADVRQNVTLGAPYSDDEVMSALELAEGAAFVAELPGGLSTELGERGVGLSGGQRQRVALARALLRRPALLLLDDTTSALDPTTETKVLTNLRRALADTTVLAVASRPSTIALADDVLFLAGGRIVAHGSHRDLMESDDDYRRLIAAFEHDRGVPDDVVRRDGDAR